LVKKESDYLLLFQESETYNDANALVNDFNHVYIDTVGTSTVYDYPMLTTEGNFEIASEDFSNCDKSIYEHTSVPSTKYADGNNYYHVLEDGGSDQLGVSIDMSPHITFACA
jgi:hypothetical protein